MSLTEVEQVDLATSAPVRGLNAGAAQIWVPETNRTLWRVLNPRGQHALAVGIDAPGAGRDRRAMRATYCAGHEQGRDRGRSRAMRGTGSRKT